MKYEIRHFHPFCGSGFGAAGFNRGNPRVGSGTASFRCIGGIDSDPAAIRDFARVAGVAGTCMDLFTRDQYIAWHGCEPPRDWREATPADFREAAGNERPHIIFTSPPCKGFSGLLSQTKSNGPNYQALNELTLRGIHLALEAWAGDPAEFFLLENVPRITSRGRHLLDAITGLLEGYGYAVAETVHDCGELGGLAQSRRRFLLVARHQEKVPPFLYEPPKRPLRGVGEVLGRLPVPGDMERGGAMHRLPRLQWKTWLRLALIDAGKDWRALQHLRVVDGYLADMGIVPEVNYRASGWGVLAWDQPAGTIAGRSYPTNGRFSIADPRPGWKTEYSQLGVGRWTEPASTITSQRSPGQGRFSVADPRCDQAGSGGAFRIVSFTESGQVPEGAQTVPDPRLGMDPNRKHYRTGGQYGIVSWTEPAGVVNGSARHDSGRHSVADPRLPAGNASGVWVIRALDGTWHRPFTTLELAALQSLVDPDDPKLELDGVSDTAWRERIGNGVPSSAGEAMAVAFGTTLLLAWSGQTFALGSTPIWVRPMAIAVAVDTGARRS